MWSYGELGWPAAGLQDFQSTEQKKPKEVKPETEGEKRSRKKRKKGKRKQ
jgi:hypothetical protein